MKVANGRAKFLLVVYLLLLAYFVFTPRPDLVDASASPKFGGKSIFDFLMHSILYLKGFLANIGNVFLLWPLAILLPRAFSRQRPLTTFYFCCVMSIGIELGQRYVPGRVPDIFDVIANIAGVAVLLAFLNFKRQRSTLKT